MGFVRDQLKLGWRDDIVTSREDVLALVCWCAPEQAALEREIEQQPERVDALLAHESAQRVAKLEAQLLELELLEEGLVVKAPSDGLVDILRRPDAAPQAVLAVTIVKPKEVAA